MLGLGLDKSDKRPNTQFSYIKIKFHLLHAKMLYGTTFFLRNSLMSETVRHKRIKKKGIHM